MITYPVSKTKRFAIVVRATKKIVEKGIRWRDLYGRRLKNFPADLAILEMIEGLAPPFNPNTHKLAFNVVIDIPNESITRVRTAVPLSAEELAAAQELKKAKDAYVALKNGTGTAQERQVRTEKVLAFVLKEMFGES